MGMLRERVAVDLRLRGFSPVTQRMYLGCAQRFAADHHQPPTALGEAEVRTFLDHLVRERRISRAALGVYVAAVHFLYRVTLDRPDVVQRIRYPRRGRERFPEILSPAEVERLLGAGRSLKHRAMVMVAYGAGLRASELCALTAALPRRLHAPRRAAATRARPTPAGIRAPPARRAPDADGPRA